MFSNVGYYTPHRENQLKLFDINVYNKTVLSLSRVLALDY